MHKSGALDRAIEIAKGAARAGNSDPANIIHTSYNKIIEIAQSSGELEESNGE